jgi:uncharacterized lipoprotein YajG
MIILKYWNPQLQIALANWRTVHQFPGQQLMIAEVHQGKLHYRLKGSSKRVSYARIKKGLQKKEIRIKEELMPF